MTTNETRGAKYDSKMTTAEIAKAIRSDIKAAVKAGELPAGMKVSVRTGGGRTCSAIDVRVKALPEGFQAFEPVVDRNGYIAFRHTAAAARIVSMLKSIMDDYNRDASDAMVDYFDCRFYGHAEIDWNLEPCRGPEVWSGRAGTAQARITKTETGFGLLACNEYGDAYFHESANVGELLAMVPAQLFELAVARLGGEMRQAA